MKATIKVHVSSVKTDSVYEGEANVRIENPRISRTFSFTFCNPNDLNGYEVTINYGRELVLTHKGALSIREQLDSYNDHQLTIFALLYRVIFDGVKEAQRFYGGTTIKKPIVEKVEEFIKAVGTEPLACISFTREFVWRERDEDMFEVVCDVLRS